MANKDIILTLDETIVDKANQYVTTNFKGIFKWSSIILKSATISEIQSSASDPSDINVFLYYVTDQDKWYLMGKDRNGIEVNDYIENLIVTYPLLQGCLDLLITKNLSNITGENISTLKVDIINALGDNLLLQYLKDKVIKFSENI